MLRITILHNGKRHPSPLEVDPGTPSSSFREAVAAHLSLPADTPLRLLHAGKRLPDDSTPLSAASLTPTATIYALATPREAVAAVRASKPDALVRPFSRAAPRYVAAPRQTRPPPGSAGASPYGFGRVEALPGFADTARAQQILEGLAADPGFLSVMRRKQWRVGALKEMPPEGRVGVDPVCVLGYNTNKGAEIHLRLRTDDRQGFRAMSSVRQVLAHELAHNEVSDHNDEFKELMRWIEREANKADWRRSAGHAVVDGWRSSGVEGVDPLQEAEVGAAARVNIVRRLGSATEEERVANRPNASAIPPVCQHCEREEPGMQDVEMKPVAEPNDGGEQVQQEETPNQDETETLVAPPSLETDSAIAANVAGDSNASAQTAPTPKKPTDAKPKTKVDELVDMGFSRRLAALALRENGNNSTRAADWVVSLAMREGPTGSGSVLDSERPMTDAVSHAMARLRAAGLGHEEYVSALDTLHLYLSNLLRNPGVERFSRINASNPGFRRRVGSHDAATALLAAAGFRLRDGFWTYTSLDMGPLWFTKSMVQDNLVEELQQ